MSKFITSNGEEISVTDCGKLELTPIQTVRIQTIYIVEDGIMMDGLGYEYRPAFYASSLERAKEYVEKDVQRWVDIYNERELKDKEEDTRLGNYDGLDDEPELLEIPQWETNKSGMFYMSLDEFEKKWLVIPTELDKDPYEES
jgi:hypothetical protein